MQPDPGGAAGSDHLAQALSPLRAAGLALALGGVLVVLTRGDAWALARLAFGQGDLWVLLAATGWAFYTVLQKRLTLPAVPDGARLAAMMLGGAIALAPFAGIEAAAGATPPGAIRAWRRCCCSWRSCRAWARTTSTAG
ncbi:hypothetical protein WJ973_00220 [Achromobacter xylosoxidans]